jgi:hypothetical protein
VFSLTSSRCTLQPIEFTQRIEVESCGVRFDLLNELNIVPGSIVNVLKTLNHAMLGRRKFLDAERSHDCSSDEVLSEEVTLEHLTIELILDQAADSALAAIFSAVSRN